MAKATKKEILEQAEKGGWFYFNGESRCNHCGEYDFTGKHLDDCPLGALLELIEKGMPE